ncbi:hypothetical protein OSC02_21975 [Enterobacter hormaechei]|uniref:hypothetical protein n=1 Tax=Enterobacter hormaechei TaxID=158836 RepID=UPI0028766211|nr:hypothetical protein [Enterobacter hormaechei]MDS0952242.1 hypothetical protein [Enterobacter hormaechei]
MSNVTKEWLQKTIAELEEERDATPGAVNEDASNALAAMKLALASLEAEPVCVIDQSNLDYLKSGSDADVWPASRTEMGDVLLYRAAPPAPVSVPAAMEMDDDFDSAFEHGKAVGWNAYRAAMLQSFGNSEQLNSPVIPDGYCIMPLKLTADNGAKGALCGEFHVEYRIVCQACVGEGCEDCNHTGGWNAEIPVGWDTIKRIHEAAVEACALPAAPQQEVK